MLPALASPLPKLEEQRCWAARPLVRNVANYSSGSVSEYSRERYRRLLFPCCETLTQHGDLLAVIPIPFREA